MLGRRAKAGILVAALLVLVLEGVLLVGYYDRYYGSGVGFAANTAAPSGPAASKGTTPEGTMPEGTASRGEAHSDAEGVSYLHTATDENSRGDYTYLDHPALNGDPNAVVLVVSSEGAEGADYAHNVGVWYEFADRERWAIFNQDLAAVPAGTTFRVSLPPPSESFVHRAGTENTADNATYLDSPLTNGKPGADLSVTQNWNPGGGGGVYNDHPVGIVYDGDVRKWAVYNQDGAPIPRGAAFNVAVSGASGG